MWQHSDPPLSDNEQEKMRDIQSKMEKIIDAAVSELPTEGICLMVVYEVDSIIRVGNISNIQTPYLMTAIKEWIRTREQLDEPDHFDG